MLKLKIFYRKMIIVLFNLHDKICSVFFKVMLAPFAGSPLLPIPYVAEVFSLPFPKPLFSRAFYLLSQVNFFFFVFSLFIVVVFFCHFHVNRQVNVINHAAPVGTVLLFVACLLDGSFGDAISALVII